MEKLRQFCGLTYEVFWLIGNNINHKKNEGCIELRHCEFRFFIGTKQSASGMGIERKQGQGFGKAHHKKII
ncbi:MAG: hypothetical protein EOP00_02735 [Pedobacter sp.]|nr:MAG: hypothetical protein EOP00_02735 [Pedobacter sp.]